MEKAEYDGITASIKSSIDGFGGKLSKLQTQVDAIDQKITTVHNVAAGRKGLKAMLEESDQFQRLVHDRRGRAVLTLEGDDVASALQTKTTITSPVVGYQTTGVLQIERIPGIVPEPRRQLRVRDLLPQRPTVLQVVDYVKVTSPMTIASPQVESSPKAENQVQFTSYSERIKMIATWIPATKQIMDDFAELSGYIETALPYYVDLAEELGLLAGDGTGENLHGILPQATAFNTGLLVPASGWTRIDIIGRAIQQTQLAYELPPTFVILNPTDWWALRMTKDSYGRYIIGDPSAGQDIPRLFDLDVVMSPSMTLGTFLVGSGNPTAIEIRDRMQMQIEISTEHQDYFVRNMIAIRAEKRLALVVKRGGSFITGSLTSSPVS
jgi:HK97 family phage major capsid protein